MIGSPYASITQPSNQSVTMENFPPNTVINVTMTNGRRGTFRVGTNLLLSEGPALSGKRRAFRTFRSLHRYCSAFGNILEVGIYNQRDHTFVTITSGLFQRSRLPIRSAAPTLQRTATLEAPHPLRRCNAIPLNACRCGVSPGTSCKSCYPGLVCERLRR